MVDARTRESLLWALVGGLAFLVLVQGYDLLDPRSVGAVAKAAVAIAVAAVTGMTAYAARPRLHARRG